MDRPKLGLVVAAFGAVVVTRLFVPTVPGKAEREERQAASRRQEAAEKAARLAGESSWLVSHPNEQFTVAFPAKPDEKTTVLVGLSFDFDRDWDLAWFYDTTFAVRRRHAGGPRDPVDLAADRRYLDRWLQATLDREKVFHGGTPMEWAVTARREFTVQGRYAGLEIDYTYKKFTQQLDRSGRYRLIKVPGTGYVLHVDGDPDVLASPLTDSFFASFTYLPAVPLER